MKEIVSSNEVGSSTSAGTRLFNNSTERLESGGGAGVKVGSVDTGSNLSDCDARRDEGVLNLTAGFTYGRERLLDESL